MNSSGQSGGGRCFGFAAFFATRRKLPHHHHPVKLKYSLSDRGRLAGAARPPEGRAGPRSGPARPFAGFADPGSSSGRFTLPCFFEPPPLQFSPRFFRLPGGVGRGKGREIRDGGRAGERVGVVGPGEKNMARSHTSRKAGEEEQKSTFLTCINHLVGTAEGKCSFATTAGEWCGAQKDTESRPAAVTNSRSCR